MKALTLWEPWATLIALGHKQVETRPWMTSHRGELFIHAAATKKHCKHLDVLSLCQRGGLSLAEADVVFHAMKPGHILASVQVGEVRATARLLADDDIDPKEMAFGNYGPGRAGWKLYDLVRLEKPVPAKGRQQFWYPPPEVQAAVRAQLRTAS